MSKSNAKMVRCVGEDPRIDSGCEHVHAVLRVTFDRPEHVNDAMLSALMAKVARDVMAAYNASLEPTPKISRPTGWGG